MAEQVFMCYARQDEGFVLELAGALRAQGVPVWIDQWDIPGGADWALEVEEALYRSSHLLVVISPASRASDEVRGEWRAAVEEGIPVIPVLFQECRIPPRLRLLQHIDFTSRPPVDATAVGEIVSALGMGQPTREEETRPPTVSAEPVGGSGSERPGQREPVLSNGEVSCPECGGDVARDAVFCSHCGLALLVSETGSDSCPDCGARIVPGMMFCDNCGARLPEPVPEPSGNICPYCRAGNVPGALFCDNCGSTLRVAAPSGKVCPACGAAYEVGTVFCENCGALLKPLPPVLEPSGKICPACKAENPPDNPFCHTCGYALSSAPSA